MLRVILVCAFFTSVLASLTPAQLATAQIRALAQRVTTAVTTGTMPSVPAPPGIQGTFVAYAQFTDSGCTTQSGVQFFNSGTCLTTGVQFSSGTTVAGSLNGTFDGTTLTLCFDYGSFTCSSQIGLCAAVATTSCTGTTITGYTRAYAATGSFTSVTSWNSSTCSGLPAGPASIQLNTCQAGIGPVGPYSAETSSGYTRCNYTDTQCATKSYCITCAPGACCTDASFDGESLRLGAAATVAPSLLVLAAAALVAALAL